MIVVWIDGSSRKATVPLSLGVCTARQVGDSNKKQWDNEIGIELDKSGLSLGRNQSRDRKNSDSEAHSKRPTLTRSAQRGEQATMATDGTLLDSETKSAAEGRWSLYGLGPAPTQHRRRDHRPESGTCQPVPNQQASQSAHASVTSSPATGTQCQSRWNSLRLNSASESRACG